MFFMLASAALYVLETAILLAFLKQGCFAKFAVSMHYYTIINSSRFMLGWHATL